MRRHKIQLVNFRCPRCCKKTVGLNRPIYGSQAVHLRFAGLCQACATEAEKHLINEGSAIGILGRTRE